MNKEWITEIGNGSLLFLLNYCPGHLHGEDRSIFSHSVAVANSNVDEKLPEILVTRVFPSSKVNGLIGLWKHCAINLHTKCSNSKQCVRYD